MATIKNKILKILIPTTVVLMIGAISIVGLRFRYTAFRYNFDVIFNCDDMHLSYHPDESGEFLKYSLPLPPSTAFAYRQSDTSVTYYTKQSYDSFLSYYQENGYAVLDGTVYSGDDLFFPIALVNSDEEFKYNFIEIETFVIPSDGETFDMQEPPE